ncbi:polyprenyl synthetase family protein [Haliangium sp.]|uniref:polyprenyl synthetase family protein n=1 Tax=Haliangium sp. TaxID=2663208 RepID=UPI003D118CC0
MSGRGPDPLVSSLLAEYGAVTRRALDAYLPAREPRRYLYDVVADYPQRGGKMMRPSLCIATARAFGAATDDALHAAVAIELIHNAMLIHDDIEDESEERRGRPTLHELHGVPLALNAGDALTLLSLRPILDGRTRLGPRVAMRMLEETERMARESAEGQALELGWRRDNVLDLDDRDYLDLVLKKTCWLATIFPARVGALIATRDGIDLDPFIRLGFFLGAAFQIQDDVLNLVGDRARYGKEIAGDLREGKRTLVLIHLARHADDSERARLLDLLGRPRPQRTDADVEWMLGRMDAYGSIDYARRVAQGLAGAARHECARIFHGLPLTRDRRFIEELATWVFERSA